MAGPAFIDPPRSSTTRMIANSSTTDSEMATTDHTLGRSALPARGCDPAPPPEPSCHQRGRPMRRVTHRPVRPRLSRALPLARTGPMKLLRTAIRGCTRTANSLGSFQSPHNLFAAVSNYRPTVSQQP
jgi:hypothetical protein